MSVLRKPAAVAASAQTVPGTAAAPREQTIPFRRWPWILAAAVLVKVLFVTLLHTDLLPASSVNLGMFPDGYDALARSLVEGRGYRMYDDTSPTMIRTPGYVLILAGLFALTGPLLAAAQAANIAFSTLTAWLVVRITRQLGAAPGVAYTAALATLLHPAVFVADSRGGPESLLMLLVTLLAWITLKLPSHLSAGHFFCWGVCHGAAMLVKSSVALLLPVALLWVWLAARRSCSPAFLLRGAIIAILASLACQLPWIARNYAISGRFVATMTVGSVAAFQGQYVVRHHDSGRQHGALLDEAADRQGELARQMGLRHRGYYFLQFASPQQELTYYDALGRLTWQGYAADPLLIARALTFNALAFWTQGRTDSMTTVNTVLAAPLLLLAAVGAVLQRRRVEVLLLLAFVAAYVAPHLITMAIARYQVPILPLMVILAVAPWFPQPSYPGSHLTLASATPT